MLDLVNALNGIVWSSALIYLCLGAGLWFSVRTRFVQVRAFRDMCRLMFKGESSPAGVSSFQALALSLSGRVGTGNIAGVAAAIFAGGPGAVFWMWVVAFLGASTAYIESTLGQIYKEVGPAGQYRGGPAFYIEKALGLRWYACIFAVATVLAMGFLMPGIQSNSVAVAMNNAWGLPRGVTACVLAVALLAIVYGGVKRIAAVVQYAVPFMALAYLAIALIVIAVNIAEVPAMLTLIIRSALGLDSVFGAIIGTAIAWGVKRGVYSNEAGQGTGPHPAAAAEVSHPAKQGLVQAFSVYIDTLLLCTATAFMILSTGQFNVRGADGTMLVSNLEGIEKGVGYTQAAVDTLAPGMGASFVAVALLFFTFTTVLAYYYIAETNVTYLERHQNRPWAMHLLKIGMTVSVVYGAVHSATGAWALGDLGLGLMAWLNIIAIIFIARPALVALDDYEAQRRAGKDPVFDPTVLGIKGADFWIGR